MKLPTTFILAGFLFAGWAAPTPAAAQHPDLSGRWTFNAVQSDPNPTPDRMQSSDSSGAERHGGHHQGMGGGMSETHHQRTSQTIALALRTPAAFTIAETDSTVTFTQDNAPALLFNTDGRKHRQHADSVGRGDVEITTLWQGNALVVERQVSGGGKVTEDYFRSQDGKQLFVIVNVDAGNGSLAFRRVYDAAPLREL